MGNLWNLQTAFLTLMLLPMVPNATYFGYGFVPLPPYLEQNNHPYVARTASLWS
jgi:hypothetical protein